MDKYEKAEREYLDKAMNKYGTQDVSALENLWGNLIGEDKDEANLVATALIWRRNHSNLYVRMAESLK